MTEKSYGGNNGVREHLGKTVKDKTKSHKEISKAKSKQLTKEPSSQDKSPGYADNELESYKKAGEIAIKIKEYTKELIRPGMTLLKIAKKIHEKIHELCGEIAFPVNLSIDDIAAHYHPAIGDETKAEGLLKIDLGVHINGYIADCAFSLDLTPDGKYKELIKASEEAVDSALKLLEKYPDSTLNDIGKSIQESIQKKGFSPIVNLSGHSLQQYIIHAGITIPNYANNNHNKLEPGTYAIEPFATIGEGKVIDGQSSNIFAIKNLKNPRGPTARKILEYASEKYKTLPFSLREIQEKFGPMARLAIRELEQNGMVHNFPQLIEISHKPVSQAEHTFIKTPDGKIIVTTR